jgi:predicted dehydrogenase
LASLRQLLGPACAIELFVADPEANVRSATLERFPHAIAAPDSHETLDKVIRLTAEDRVPAIIYDATPPHVRAGNLDTVATARKNGYPITLLLEKPIAVTADELTRISLYAPSDDFFCDFIDIGNDAFRALRGYIRDNSLVIDRIACWRANSSGIRRSLGDGRDGVQGGALLDKAAHDVALVACLLASEDALYEAAEIHHTVPNSSTSWHSVDGRIEFGNGPDVWGKDDLLLPADGTTSVDSVWRVGERDVPVSFVWGWLGTTGISHEADIVQVLANLGHTRPFILNHVVDLVEEQRKYRSVTEPGLFPWHPKVFSDDDVRLLVLSCGSHTLVCNLLGKAPAPGVAIGRYVLDYVDGQEHVVFESPTGTDLRRVNRTDLAHVLGLALRSQTDPGCAVDISRRRAEFVHRFVIDARALAFFDFEATAGHFATVQQESIDLIERKLRTTAATRLPNEADAGGPPMPPQKH